MKSRFIKFLLSITILLICSSPMNLYALETDADLLIHTDVINIVPADLYVDSEKKCTIYGKYNSGISYKVEVTVKYKYNDLNGNLTSITSWSSKYYPISDGYTGVVLAADVKKAGTKSINIAISVQCNETGEYDYTGDTFTV